MTDPRPIIGYRGWLITPNGHLAPPHRGRFGDEYNPWKPRSLAVAECGRTTRFGSFKAGFWGASPPAHKEHRCGLYGHFTLKHAMVKEGHSVSVLGAFVGFGSTVLHATGLRAGKARIVGLLHPEERGSRYFELPRKVAELYEIPLFYKAEELEAEAERWGEPRVPEEDLFDPEGLKALAVTASKISSTAITAAQMASAWGGMVQPQFRSKVKAIFDPSVSGLHFTETVDITGIRKLEVKGLSSEWVVMGHNIEYPVEEVPMTMAAAGEYPKLKPARYPRIELHLEGSFASEEAMKKAVGALQRLGQVVEVSVSRIR